MAALLDLVNFHSLKGLDKNAIPFFSHHYYVPNGNKQKITFNKHFAQKYIRAYTIACEIMIRIREMATNKKSSGI